MKLYYTAGACSLTTHILLCETGLPFSSEKVNLKDKTTASGQNFYQITPRGQVPALVLDDSTVLTENIAIAQYIADLSPQSKLLAPLGDIARYQTLSWFNYIATEIHTNYRPVFHPTHEDVTRDAIKGLLERYQYINDTLAKTPYLTGDHFTIADAYLFVTNQWMQFIPNCPTYPAIEQFMARINERPAVKTAKANEKSA